MDVHFTAPQDGGSTVAVIYQFFNAGVYVDYSFVLITPTHGQTQNDLYDAALASMNSYASAHSYTVSAVTGWYPDNATTSRIGLLSTADKTKLDTIISTNRSTSALSLSLVGTGATGTQISSTKDSTVRLSVSTSTTSTIGGPSTSLVVLKTCATNDATEGNWTSVATLESDQTITLAVVLQSVQIVKGQICADVPAGYYVKLVNSGTGTHSEAFVSGQKTIYG